MNLCGYEWNNKHQQRNRRNWTEQVTNVFALQLFTQWKKEKKHKLVFDIMWYVWDWTQVPSALHDGLSNLQSSILEIVIASFTLKENAARRIKLHQSHLYKKKINGTGWVLNRP